jgi:hypothetical protein
MKSLYKIIFCTFLVLASSCSLDGDLENPNEVPLTGGDPTLILNGIQLEFGDFFEEARVISDQLVRMDAMTGGDTYDRAYTPESFDVVWNRAYQDVLSNIAVLKPLAKDQNLTTHLASARILEAYTYLTLVDLFGDVPRSQALQGASNFNPAPDEASSVYDYAIKQLDTARTELALTDPIAVGPALTRDIYYGGNRARWAALANTLELKAQVNLSSDPANSSSRTRIAALLNADLIDTDAEEFTYKYGTVDVPARSRHPRYQQYYDPIAGSAAGYIGNYFLKQAFNGKGVQDPRWRYYFYRQVGSINRALAVDRESVPCVLTPPPAHYASTNQPFCTINPGFYGRDHANNDGGPPDSNVITCVGPYPAGGRMDTNNGNVDYFDDTVRGDGGNGRGIEPIWMAFFTDFVKAEIALRLNIPASADAKVLMNSGITKSIARVRAFSNSVGQTLPAGLEPSTGSYINAVNALYDAPAADRLDVAMTEYYLALWGNGLEAYNLYRRTSSPRSIQPTRALQGGDFFRSLIYPAVFVNLNSSAEQKLRTEKIFWEKNPETLK